MKVNKIYTNVESAVNQLLNVDCALSYKYLPSRLNIIEGLVDTAALDMLKLLQFGEL